MPDVVGRAEMPEPNYNRFVGRLVKVVYKEEPSAPVEVRKGELIGYDGDFVELRSFENTHLINRRSIIAIKVFGEGLKAGRGR
jgi:ribosome maturation factor RimP